MDEPQQVLQAEQQYVHSTITCDGCGASPIVGTRYQSRTLWDYDLCETCVMESGQDLSDYNAFRSPPSPQEIVEAATEATPEQVQTAFSPHDAAMLLNNIYNENNLHPEKVPRMANYQFSYQMGLEYYEELSSALAKNTTITFLRIHMCGGLVSKYGERIAMIAQGIRTNTSIQRLHWHMGGKQDRIQATENTKSSLYNMIVQNRTLEELFINRACHLPSWLPEARGRLILNDDYYAEDEFAQNLIIAMQHSKSLKRVRLDGFNPLSNHCKRLFAEAIQKSESLVKIYANFLEEDCYLDLLLEDKRHGWSKRFCDTCATTEDRLHVLLEAKEMTKLGAEQPLFYLLRKCPEVLSQIRRPS